MHILIDNKEAVLKKGASFDYIVENRFFTGADSYSLSMSFPLKGCAQNLAIFGHINRKDSNLDKLLLECEIHDRNFHEYGAVNIVEISDTEVKTQFLVGKSVQNFLWDLDDAYINNCHIGQARDNGHYPCAYYWGIPASPHYCGYVCLPWVNNTSGNMQNSLVMRAVGWCYADTDRNGDATLSCQYFLIFVLKRILEECGYSYDLTELERSPYRLLVIFNTFPVAWGIDEWGMALPHWTVTELLEQVELFTNGQFTINRKQRRVTFRFNKSILEEQMIVTIDNVVDEHQVEITEKKDTNDTYSEQVNLKYAEADHHMMKFYSCPWLINTIGRIYYNSFSELKNGVSAFLTKEGAYGNSYIYSRLLYANDIDTYFVLRCFKMAKGSNGKMIHYMRITPVNVFEPRIFNNEEDAQVTELRIVPVCIDHASDAIGDCVFLECGSYGDVEDEDENQTLAVNTLSDGEPEKKEEFYDKLYVGFWDGTDTAQNWGNSNFYPIPWVDNIIVNPDNNICMTHMNEQEDYSMRLNGKLVNEKHLVKHKVDQSIKFTFKFLISDGEIPDVNSIFYIHGRKYLAEKITATFSEDGISQLVKMVAYRIKS